VIALLAPGDLAAQARMSEALMAGLARTTIRRLLLVGDFDMLDVPGDYGEAERECADQVVDGLQRSALRWTLINRPRTLADEGLARVAAGMVDILELDLHRGEHLNFVV
jgi:hypothetical protein